MKLVRPAKLDIEGNDIPPLVQIQPNTGAERSPLTIGILFLLLFIVGSGILLGIFSFYDKYFKEPKYIPHYKTLRDNLTMPDGRLYWDNNNQTDMLIASNVLEEDMNRQISERNDTNMTLDGFLNSVNLSKGPRSGPVYAGGASA